MKGKTVNITVCQLELGGSQNRVTTYRISTGTQWLCIDGFVVCWAHKHVAFHCRGPRESDISSKKTPILWISCIAVDFV